MEENWKLKHGFKTGPYTPLQDHEDYEAGMCEYRVLFKI